MPLIGSRSTGRRFWSAFEWIVTKFLQDRHMASTVPEPRGGEVAK